jgi:hypothetical protein
MDVKLIMETILETKASSILEFLHGLRGELHVTGLRMISDTSIECQVVALDGIATPFGVVSIRRSQTNRNSTTAVIVS